jgi:hypothetical protein
MPTFKERVASLEGRVQEQATSMADLRGTGSELRHEVSELRADMGRRFSELRAEMDRRFDRMDRHFAWLVGIVVTGFVTVIGTVAGAFWGLLQVVR